MKPRGIFHLPRAAQCHPFQASAFHLSSGTQCSFLLASVVPSRFSNPKEDFRLYKESITVNERTPNLTYGKRHMSDSAYLLDQKAHRSLSRRTRGSSGSRMGTRGGPFSASQGVVCARVPDLASQQPCFWVCCSSARRLASVAFQAFFRKR